jgi:hypothetical protein
MTALQDRVHHAESVAREAEHYLARRQTHGSSPERGNESWIAVNDHVPRANAHSGGMDRRTAPDGSCLSARLEFLH